MKKIPKREYTTEFKELAVKRVKDGQSAGAVATNQTLNNMGHEGLVIPAQPVIDDAKSAMDAVKEEVRNANDLGNQIGENAMGVFKD